MIQYGHMELSFIRHHRKELIAFSVGILLAALALLMPNMHRALDRLDQLGYAGMFLTGIMYGSGLTSGLAIIIFADAPSHLNPILVGLIGGLGSALYDLLIFQITRQQSEHGWLASVLQKIRHRHPIPNWIEMLTGFAILVSPLPDELAAGLFGLGKSRARKFFAYSFASNTIGVLIINGVF